VCTPAIIIDTSLSLMINKSCEFLKHLLIPVLYNVSLAPKVQCV
jgi:hypothetical protein